MMKFYIQSGRYWLWTEERTWHIMIGLSIRDNRGDWFLAEGGGISYLIKLKIK